MSNLASSWVHDTVSALAYSLAQPHAAAEAADLQPPYNDLTQFVLRQHAQMPDYLKTPMRAATTAFDLLGCVRNGHLFHSRAPKIRQKQIEAWKGSSINFQRDFIRYYESLAMLALYSRGGERAGSDGLHHTGEMSFDARLRLSARAPEAPLPLVCWRRQGGTCCLSRRVLFIHWSRVSHFRKPRCCRNIATAAKRWRWAETK